MSSTLTDAFGRVRYGVLVFALSAGVFAALLGLHAYKNTLLDLKAFACAGHAFATGADPYREAAVRPCERALNANVFAGQGFDQPTIPVPWPPYAMPILAALALLPSGVGAVVWTLLDFACLGVAAELLRRANPSRSPVSIAALVVFAGVPTEAALGQPVGVGLLAVACAGHFVRTRSTFGIAGALAVTAIQPYIALPLALSLLFAGRTAQRAVVICAAVVGGVSLLALRPLTLEYLRVVAPLHARANLLEITQVSLTGLLATVGVAGGIAQLVGYALYAAAIVVGIWAGRRLAAATGQSETLPWVAVLCGALFAPYVHYQQLSAAIPGALVVMQCSPLGRLASVATIGLFVPWIGLIVQTVYSYTIAPFAALIAWNGPRARAVQAVGLTACVLFVVDLIVSATFRAHLINPPSFVLGPVAPQAYIDDAWQPFIAVGAQAMGVSSLAARLVTIVCAGLLAFAAISAAVRPNAPRSD